MGTCETSSERSEFEEHFRQWSQRGADPAAIVALYPMLTGPVTLQIRAERWLNHHLGYGDPSDPENQAQRRVDLQQAIQMRKSTGLPPAPGDIRRDFDLSDRQINEALDKHWVPVKQSAKFADNSHKPLTNAEHEKLARQGASYATAQDKKFSRRKPGHIEFSYLPGMLDESADEDF